MHPSKPTTLIVVIAILIVVSFVDSRQAIELTPTPPAPDNLTPKGPLRPHATQPRGIQVPKIPTTHETRADLIVSGRTSTVRINRAADVDQLIPPTFADPSIKNTPGMSWFVSQHFALKTDLSIARVYPILDLLELAYPHLLWTTGRPPKDIKTKRIPIVIAKTKANYLAAVKSDLNVVPPQGASRFVSRKNLTAYLHVHQLGPYALRHLLLEAACELHSLIVFGPIVDHHPALLHGPASAIASHVYDPGFKRLTVNVIDKPTTPNPWLKGVRKLKSKRLNASDILLQNLGDADIWTVFTHFFWTDVQREYQWRLFRDNAYKIKDNSPDARQKLAKRIFGKPDHLNKSFETWLDQTPTSFGLTHGSWDQRGQWIQFTPATTQPKDPKKKHPAHLHLNMTLDGKTPSLRNPLAWMDYPSRKQSSLVDPIRVGWTRGVIGCLIDFAQAKRKGQVGVGLGFHNDKYLSILVDREKLRLNIEASTIGLPSKSYRIPRSFTLALKESRNRLGMTVRIEEDDIHILLRAGKKRVRELKFNHPIQPNVHRRLKSQPFLYLAEGALISLIPYVNEKPKRNDNLFVSRPVGRWRFAGHDQLYALYRAQFHLGENAPQSLTELVQFMTKAASSKPDQQKIAIRRFNSQIQSIVADVRKLDNHADAANALSAVQP